MKSRILISLAVIAVAALIFAGRVTLDGERVVPDGDGTVALDAGDFEAFPLPDYAAQYLTQGYKSYFVEVEPGIKVHVLEVGSGFPLLLLHGNPTSGFLYRKVAEALPTDRVRVIMPTLVGLGFSSKVPASEHTLDNHIRWIHGVLEQLKLTELVYAGQDWGGPIGMGALARSPDLLKGVVVLNTFFNAAIEEGDLSRGHAIAKRPVVGELLLEVLVSIFENLPRNQGDPDSLPPDVLDLYARPVEESGNAKAPLAMMRMVPDGPDHPTTPAMRVIERYVQGLDIPAELVWGMNDPILAKALPLMKQNFPDALVTETAGGHFLQEEVPAPIAAALLRVMDQMI
ncbi:MAG: alpha/beta fold hydrolase [Myxococcota bacterium]|nr:alpha/beta fold hydrolase [Myxococcota bacterium]